MSRRPICDPRTTTALVVSFIAASLHAASPTAANGQEPFSEEAAARGVNYISTFSGITYGFGVALVDLDGDHDADLVALGRIGGTVGLYENDGTGHFTDRGIGSGIPQFTQASGVTAADYDGDGDLDLYFSNYEIPNVLMRNDGGFHFTDVTDVAGVGDPRPAMACAWADYDNDGWLDLYVANYDLWSEAGENRLYHNEGDGTFVDVAKALGVESPELTFQPVFFDFDRDGDADLYLSTDHGYSGFGKNHLFRNDGGTFTEISESSGCDAAIDGMGLAVGDFDGDLLQDIYCTNSPPGNPLFLNQGNGQFAEQSGPAGVATYRTGWGTLFFDYDNDGHLDLYVCNMGTPNCLYPGLENWPCTDRGAELGVADTGYAFGVAAADLDGDGDLDLMVQNNGSPLRLFINHEGEQRHWIRFNVIGRRHDRRAAIGARVEIQTGDLRQVREVFAGGNYKSQNEATLHFGINTATVVDEVTVTWPGGGTRTLTNMPADRVWALYPPEALGDADLDGAVTASDFAIFAACHDPSGPVSVEPGCEAMDLDTDGDVDDDDFSLFLNRYEEPLQDCDENGTADLLDIITGASSDQDHNLVPDPCDSDTDSDTVIDALDNCPTLVNSDQVDTDLDGFGDACDECPDDPNKVVPGTCGCGVADGDTDGDDVPDCIDGCPEDAASTISGTCHELDGGDETGEGESPVNPGAIGSRQQQDESAHQPLPPPKLAPVVGLCAFGLAGAIPLILSGFIALKRSSRRRNHRRARRLERM